VNAGPGHAECLGDRGRTLTIGAAGGGGGQFVGVHNRGSAPGATLVAGGSKPGHGAFQHDVPFALGDAAIIVKKNLPSPTGL
jgi:hypothetical protein